MTLQVIRPAPSGWPRISASLAYQDPVRAIDWLVAAFGFSVRIKVSDNAGGIRHSELTLAKRWSWWPASNRMALATRAPPNR